MYKNISKCPITNSTNRITYLDLGDMPLVNNLNDSKFDSINCAKFPLAIQLFTESMLSTLTVEIDPKILYTNYLYQSGVSAPYIDHCKEMFNFVNHYLELKNTDNILDIGGNDGTLLKTFLSINSDLNVLNIDASKNLTEYASKNNIPSINAFWNFDTAKKINKKFKLITTTNCFQHTLDINSFVQGIEISLDKYGIWCLEFPYLKTSLETNQFDQAYHEHIYYYMIRPLELLLNKYNLRIIKITQHPIHGGTVRLLISHVESLGQGWQPCNYSVSQTKDKEDSIHIDTYINWGNNIKKVLNNAYTFISNIKNNGAKIVGFGAAAKGCVFLNAANINYEHIDYIIDDTELKQHKFIPGTGIEVLPRTILKTDKPDYILILAHNFSEYIIQSLKDYGYTGKFILLLPEPQIL
jgi:hypothetical protein